MCFLSPPWGGPAYDNSDEDAERAAAAEAEEGGCGASTEGDCSVDERAPRAFQLRALEWPGCGMRIFDVAAAVAPSVGYYLPHSIDDLELSELAARHHSGRCDKVALHWGAGEARVKRRRGTDRATAGEDSRESRRPRAVLACFHAEPVEQAPRAASPVPVAVPTSLSLCPAPGVHARSVRASIKGSRDRRAK